MSNLKKLILFFCFFLFAFNQLFSQNNNLLWATKILDKESKYESSSNTPDFVLGPPTIYPGTDFEKLDFDAYANGYVIKYNGAKKELLVLGYDRPFNANQLLISGVFNEGLLDRVAILDKAGLFKNVFKSNSKNKNKLTQLNIFFKLSTVYGVKILLDHTNVNGWNLLKGIGLVNQKDTLRVQPKFYNEDKFNSPKITIDQNINTKECYEFNPRITSDGSKLYFVKECKIPSDQDIWVADVDTTTKGWKPAYKLPGVLNNNSHNFVSSVSLDGNRLLVGNKYKPNGAPDGPGVSVSKWTTEAKWSLPEAVDIPGLEDKDEHINFFQSFDEQAMLIALNNDQSVGELDLYVSLFNKYSKKWETPINLGKDVNTYFSEDYPYLAPDGKTLYFSSKGYPGYGGHDIFISKRLDDTWQKWSQPLNLGNYVNSKADDKGFMIANTGEYAFYNTVSYDSLKHSMDIYKINLPKSLRQQPYVVIKGRVKNTRDNSPVAAKIKFRDKSTNEFLTAYTTIQNDKNGDFSFILPHGTDYEVIVEAPNFFKINDVISLTDSNKKDRVLKDFVIEPFLDSGQVITLFSNVLFQYKQTALVDSTIDELKTMAKKLKEQGKSVIEIGGHTDNVGSDRYNEDLSKGRAKSVVDYLVSHGIRPWRLRTVGYGEAKPVSENESEEGRAKNRRVEFRILESDFSKKNQKKAVAKK